MAKGMAAWVAEALPQTLSGVAVARDPCREHTSELGLHQMHLSPDLGISNVSLYNLQGLLTERSTGQRVVIDGSQTPASKPFKPNRNSTNPCTNLFEGLKRGLP